MLDESEVIVDSSAPVTPRSLMVESPSKLGSFFLDSPVKGSTQHESVEIGIIEPSEVQESRTGDETLRDASEGRVDAAVQGADTARVGSSDEVPSDEETGGKEPAMKEVDEVEKVKEIETTERTDKIPPSESEHMDTTGDETTEEKNQTEDSEEKVVQTEGMATETEGVATETEANSGEAEIKTYPDSINENSKAASTGKKYDCDYDKNPTILFLNLQKKDWDSVIAQAAQYPVEARTWVSRREKNGKLRWKLLPIHTALIFKAPEKVVESLLGAYPRGAQSKDDQGMLPLHLAFRHGSTEGIVNLLLVAFPQSVDITDRKGRVPLVLAQASASPNRDAFVSLLKRGHSYFADAVAATSRGTALIQQRKQFDAELQEVEEKYQNEITSLTEEKMKLSQNVNSLSIDLQKYQDASEELQHLVNNLEAQICDKADSERILAMKIASLDQELQDMAAIKCEISKTLDTKLVELAKANGLATEGQQKVDAYIALKGEKETLQKDLESLSEEKESLLKTVEEMKEERTALTLKIEELEEVNETLRIASGEIGNLSKRIDELEEANKILQETKESMAGDREYALAKVITMTRENADVKVGFENTLTEWKQKASNYENMIASLEVMLKEKAEKNEKEIEKLKLTLEDKTESYEKKIGKLEDALEKTKEKASLAASEKEEAMKKKIADYEVQIDAMKAEWTRASIVKSKEHRKEVDMLSFELKKLQNHSDRKTAKELKKLKKDWANAQARAAVLEAQLNSKLENERELSSQVSTLAGKLADTSVENSNTSTRFTSLIHTLEDKCKKYKNSSDSNKLKVGALELEKSRLRNTVNELGNKLVRVSQVLKAQGKTDDAEMQDLLESVFAGIEQAVHSESQLEQADKSPHASSRAPTPRASSNSKKQVPPPVNTNFSQVEKVEEDARNSLSEALRALEVSKDTTAPKSELENVSGISPTVSDESSVVLCSSSEEGENAASFETTPSTASDDFTC